MACAPGSMVSRTSAQAALQLAGEHGLAPQIALDRWDTDVSEWQGGAGPASGPAWAEGKHAREVAEDARRSEATGFPSGQCGSRFRPARMPRD
jgi:hypothetical protein